MLFPSDFPEIAKASSKNHQVPSKSTQFLDLDHLKNTIVLRIIIGS